MPVGEIFSLLRTLDNGGVLHLASYVFVDHDVRSIIDVARFHHLNQSHCHPGCPFSAFSGDTSCK